MAIPPERNDLPQPRPLDARTRLVTLLGYPVGHSLSPRLHNAAFAAQGLNWAYVATAVRPEDVDAAVAGLRALDFAGANVTVPHKQAVLPHLDVLSPRARAVGAVNTIVCRREDEDAPIMLYGDNTDVAGFLEPLQPYLADLRGVEMLILGAGGAARAVAYALLDAAAPSRLTLAARRPEQAEQLASDLAPHDAQAVLAAVPLADAGDAVRRARLIVNATPLGMHPHTDVSPWSHAGDFAAGHIAYDLVYNPRETRFLREAAAAGATPVGGLGMLVGQAAAAYALWTGREMPREVAEQAATFHFDSSG